MPTPTPTLVQIEQVQTAILTETLAITAVLIADLTDEQWAATLADLAAFQLIRHKFSNLNGQIAGLVTDSAGKRLAIRNDIRRRLGLPDLKDEYGNLQGQSFLTNSSLQWWR